MLQSIDERLFNGVNAEHGDEIARASARRCVGLAGGLGLMVAVDAWLVMHLAQSISAVLAQARAAVIPALAAAGCAAMTGVALLLTWLLLGDLFESLRRNFSMPRHKN